LITPQQRLKDGFFSDLEAAKSKKCNVEAKADDSKEDGATEESIPKPKAKPKLQLKKKRVDDDPFASDEEEETKPKARTSKPPSKPTSKPPSKTRGAVRKPVPEASTAVKRVREVSESDEEEVNPKRRALKSRE